MRVHVICIGSGWGDDAAGLRVAEGLARCSLPAGVSVHRCERPVPDLLDALDGADAAVLVDGVRSGARPGAVLRLDVAGLVRAGTASSHGLGVAQALGLAGALGRTPSRIEAIGVEIGAASGFDLTLSVRGAIPEAIATTIQLVRELQSSNAETSADA